MATFQNTTTTANILTKPSPSPKITPTSKGIIVFRPRNSISDDRRRSFGRAFCISSSSPASIPNSNYVVPMEKFTSSSCITRPLAEILRDLNKRIPDNLIVKASPSPSSNADVDDLGSNSSSTSLIPWFHANRMLSFYAPGWCGEIRDVIFSDNGSVTVVYRVTVRGSDAEAHRESTGTIAPSDGPMVDPVAAAEELAFCKACARFGLGLYLYHEE